MNPRDILTGIVMAESGGREYVQKFHGRCRAFEEGGEDTSSKKNSHFSLKYILRGKKMRETRRFQLWIRIRWTIVLSTLTGTDAWGPQNSPTVALMIKMLATAPPRTHYVFGCVRRRAEILDDLDVYIPPKSKRRLHGHCSGIWMGVGRVIADA